MQIICPISRRHYRLYGVLLFISLEKLDTCALFLELNIRLLALCYILKFKKNWKRLKYYFDNFRINNIFLNAVKYFKNSIYNGIFKYLSNHFQ